MSAPAESLYIYMIRRLKGSHCCSLEQHEKAAGQLTMPCATNQGSVVSATRLRISRRSCETSRSRTRHGVRMRGAAGSRELGARTMRTLCPVPWADFTRGATQTTAQRERCPSLPGVVNCGKLGRRGYPEGLNCQRAFEGMTSVDEPAPRLCLPSYYDQTTANSGKLLDSFDIDNIYGLATSLEFAKGGIRWCQGLGRASPIRLGHRRGRQGSRE